MSGRLESLFNSLPRHPNAVSLLSPSREVILSAQSTSLHVLFLENRPGIQVKQSHTLLVHPKPGEDETLGQKEEYSWHPLLGIFFKIPPIFCDLV